MFNLLFFVLCFLLSKLESHKESTLLNIVFSTLAYILSCINVNKSHHFDLINKVIIVILQLVLEILQNRSKFSMSFSFIRIYLGIMYLCLMEDL
jgi:hypothetical protein